MVVSHPWCWACAMVRAPVSTSRSRQPAGSRRYWHLVDLVGRTPGALVGALHGRTRQPVGHGRNWLPPCSAYEGSNASAWESEKAEQDAVALARTAVRRAVRQVGQGRVLLPGWVFRPGHGVPPSPGSSRRCAAEHERCKLDCRSGVAARPFGGATLLQLGRPGRGSVGPGGQRRTAGDSEPRGHRPPCSASGPRNGWSALSHSRGHWLVRHCSALFKAALGRR